MLNSPYIIYNYLNNTFGLKAQFKLILLPLSQMCYIPTSKTLDISHLVCRHDIFPKKFVHALQKSEGQGVWWECPCLS